MHKKYMQQYLTKLLDPSISDKQKVSILDGMNQKEPTAQDLFEVIQYIRQTQEFWFPLPACVDIVGTWWSWLPRINISTPVSILLARCGLLIAKHGNNASSWRVWSFDVLWKTSFPLCQNDDDIRKYAQKKLLFLHAKLFYPVMRFVWPARKIYGKPTLFNLIWPLLHPLDPDTQLLWCSFPDKMDLMMETALLLWRKTVAVVRAEDWLDKLSLIWENRVLLRKNKTLTDMTIVPEDFGLARISSFDEIAWWDIDHNATLLQSLIDGTCQTRHADLIAMNWAFVLSMCDKVDSLKEWVEKMRRAMHQSDVYAS